MRLTTSRFPLDGPEYATTALATVVSSAGYLRGGLPYRSRGVLGDLVGFLVLAAIGVARGERVRHEALACLTGIGIVLLLDLQWPLRFAEPFWWSAFLGGCWRTWHCDGRG